MNKIAGRIVARSARIFLPFGLWLTMSVCGGTVADDPTPLPRAHAHNDYRHDRPLLDALDHGFCSVEADIFLVNGQLLIGHGRSELSEDRTLQTLYLDPLLKRVRNNNGHVYTGDSDFTLLIDIKTQGQSTYEALAAVLAGYSEMLTTYDKGQYARRAVTAVISGNRDVETIAAITPRHAGIDGRLSDMESSMPAHLMPMISDNWRRHFKWRGEDPIPEIERQKLQTIVSKAHTAGRRVRFWATPEDPAIWQELRTAGVDHINTDDLPGLQRFLLGDGK